MEGNQLRKELSAQVMQRRQSVYMPNIFKVLGGDLNMETKAKISEQTMKILSRPTNIFNIKSLAEIPNVFKKIDF